MFATCGGGFCNAFPCGERLEPPGVAPTDGCSVHMASSCWHLESIQDVLPAKLGWS